jgi:xanthine dehydrogenase small subunit
MSTRSYLRFALNGALHEVTGSDASMMLADWLRKRLYLTGTKIVCAEGDCGACTVLRAFPSTGRGRELQFEPINACITMLAQVDGAHLISVEALRQERSLAQVQEALVAKHGSQCGYCTPGFVMALSGLFEKCREKPDVQTVKNYLTGNLCRCTGYTPIVEAALSIDPESIPSLRERFVSAPLIKALKESRSQAIDIATAQGRILAPVRFSDVSTLLKKYPDASLLASGTDLGVQVNKGRRELGHVISLHLIPELYQITQKGSVYHFGAKVSLEEVRRRCAKGIPEFSRLLDVFASPQIKNSGIPFPFFWSRMPASASQKRQESGSFLSPNSFKATASWLLNLGNGSIRCPSGRHRNQNVCVFIRLQRARTLIYQRSGLRFCLI